MLFPNSVITHVHPRCCLQWANKQKGFRLEPEALSTDYTLGGGGQSTWASSARCQSRYEGCEWLHHRTTDLQLPSVVNRSLRTTSLKPDDKKSPRTQAGKGGPSVHICGPPSREQEEDRENWLSLTVTRALREAHATEDHQDSRGTTLGHGVPHRACQDLGGRWRICLHAGSSVLLLCHFAHFIYHLQWCFQCSPALLDTEPDTAVSGTWRTRDKSLTQGRLPSS